MIEVTSETPRKPTTIQSINFNCPQPYEEGHQCDSNEARALNQTLLENVSNNFAQKIKKLVESIEGIEKPQELAEDQVKELRTRFDAYCDDYEFFSGGGRESDPVRAQAMDLARKEVRRALKRKGVTLSEVPSEQITELAKNAVATKPAFMEEAARIVAEAQKAASALTIDLSSIE